MATLRRTMHPWTFTYNWFVKWEHMEWRLKCINAFVVGM